MEIQPEFITPELTGEDVVKKKTLLKDLKGFYADEKIRSGLSQDEIIYEVQAYLPVDEGTPGGLFFGITKIHPGMIGDEYYMTRGHYHEISDRAEYYWGIQGEGMLILMNRDRNIRVEKMQAGTLHYIPAHTAHRVANTGENSLAFGACWPADAGHDYHEIEKNGFSGRVRNINGVPQLTEDEYRQ